jgi:elongation factor G
MAGKIFSSDRIRNIALVGHGSAGKTTLAEAMLFLSGATTRVGRVDDHTSSLDFEPEEHKRGGSIATSLAWTDFNDHKINILDTPGDQNFIFDSFNAMRGADAVVIVVSAPDGIEVQTERVFRMAKNLGLPVAFFINKMDRDRADGAACVADIKASFKVRPVPLQIPLGAEGSFEGLMSLFQRKALVYAKDGSGEYEKFDLTPEQADEADAVWENLVESVAETNEALLEKYLDTFELAPDEIRSGFHDAMKAGELVPVLYGSASRCIGALALLELISWAFPSPLERVGVSAVQRDDLVEVSADPAGPFVAQVIHTTVDEFSGKSSIFRIFSGSVPSDNLVENAGRGKPERLGSLFTLRGRHRDQLAAAVTGDIVAVAKLKDTHTGDTLTTPKLGLVVDQIDYPAPMMAYCIHPAGKADADKIKTALDRTLDEDPTLTVGIDSLTHHLVIHGMGQAHLDMAVARMTRKYKVEVTTDLPPVPYRETLRAAVRGIEGKHKKQTGGAGQFGVAMLNVEPQARDEGFEFVNKVKGGAIPTQLIPSVEKGIVNRMTSGFLAGYPIVDIRVELTDGKYHPVDSKDFAFQLAGSKGLREAFSKGGTRLLEPVMDMEIVVPPDVMGDVMGDITSRRGRVQGMEPRGKNMVVKAMVPLAEVQRYAPDLRGMTAGKGSFTTQLHGYEEVPPHLVDGIVHSSPFHKDDDED